MNIIIDYIKKNTNDIILFFILFNVIIVGIIIYFNFYLYKSKVKNQHEEIKVVQQNYEEKYKEIIRNEAIKEAIENHHKSIKTIKENRKNFNEEIKKYKWNPKFDMDPKDIPTLEELAETKKQNNYFDEKRNKYPFCEKYSKEIYKHDWSKGKHFWCKEMERQKQYIDFSVGGKSNYFIIKTVDNQLKLYNHYKDLCNMAFLCTALYGKK